MDNKSVYSDVRQFQKDVNSQFNYYNIISSFRVNKDVDQSLSKSPLPHSRLENALNAFMSS